MQFLIIQFSQLIIHLMTSYLPEMNTSTCRPHSSWRPRCRIRRSNSAPKIASLIGACEELVTIFHHLMRAANQIQVVLMQKLGHYFRAERKRHATIILQRLDGQKYQKVAVPGLKMAPKAQKMAFRGPKGPKSSKKWLKTVINRPFGN